VTISSVSLNAPKDAKKSYEKGRDLLKKKKVPEAQKELEKAVEIYPQYATAWFELGRAKELQNDAEGARKAYAESRQRTRSICFLTGSSWACMLRSRNGRTWPMSAASWSSSIRSISRMRITTIQWRITI